MALPGLPIAGATPGGPGDVLSTIDPKLCVACKGARMLCGIDPCPLLERIRGQMPQIARAGTVGRDLWGSSPPALFVGRHGYPKVTVGPMLPPARRDEAGARRLDDPRGWMGLAIPDIVGLRSSLVRTTHAVRVHEPHAKGDIFSADRILRASQELALAARPVDTEVRLQRAPRFGAVTVAEFTAPHGPTATVERATLADNVRVEKPLERAASDTDLRAAEAIAGLYDSGIDHYQLEKVLSAGMLGLGQKRKLVPTRWSITATDDQVGQHLIDQVRDFPSVDKPTVQFAERFGNRFFVLLLPGPWSFETIEAWLKGNFWGRDAAEIVESDREDWRGRTAYASTAGGYYATRLSVLEHLIAIRRQATAIVHREITDAYTTPLGVWVVRETCKAALAARPLEFEDAASALRHIDRHALLKTWQAHATLLRQTLTRRTLDQW